jgi:Na+/H+-dicarboxylate symporter
MLTVWTIAHAHLQSCYRFASYVLLFAFLLAFFSFQQLPAMAQHKTLQI